MATNNTCMQGASILCEEATGPFFTNCEVKNYECAHYAVVQQDPSTSQDITVCLPYSATQYAEYVYGANEQSNCLTASCRSGFSQLFSVVTRKSFYQFEYNLNVRFYKNPSHTMTITYLNNTNLAFVSSKTHTKSIALELSTFAQSEISCSSCPYGQVYVSGLIQSNGYQQAQFNISN